MQHALASLLMGLGCADEAAPYVAGGLIRNGRVAATGPYAKVIEQKLLNPETCPGAVGLSEDDKYQLRAIVEESEYPFLARRQRPMTLSAPVLIRWR